MTGKDVGLNMSIEGGEMGIREDVIERLLRIPGEIEAAELRCIDGQVILDRIKRGSLEVARGMLQSAEFTASALAYGLDDPKGAKVKGRNAEIRKIELGRFLSQDEEMLAAQRMVNEVAKDIAAAEADLARLESSLHHRQNELRATIALTQLLGGRDD